MLRLEGDSYLNRACYVGCCHNTSVCLLRYAPGVSFPFLKCFCQFAPFTHGAWVVRTKLCNINNYEKVIIMYRLLKQWSEKENFLPLGITLLQTTFQIREWDTTLRKPIKPVMKLLHRWQTHTSNPLHNSDLVIDIQWNGLQYTRPETFCNAQTMKQKPICNFYHHCGWTYSLEMQTKFEHKVVYTTDQQHNITPCPAGVTSIVRVEYTYCRLFYTLDAPLCLYILYGNFHSAATQLFITSILF